jgi:glycosyltransferase involved in cell wall biosynthesis
MSDCMRVSIAMGLYNGDRYVRDQLDSIARQKRLPDEIIVSDDCSTDDSVEIVQEFATGSPFPVKLLLNESNAGVTGNFERAIKACSGDIIFLADCDDIWYSDKILLMEQALKDAPRSGVAVCDADLVDEELRPTGRRLWQARGFHLDRRMQKRMAEGKTFTRSLPTWANCMAFRAKFLAQVLPMPTWGPFVRAGQDQFIAWTIVYSGAAGIIAVPKALIAYRQHSRQMAGAGDAGRSAIFRQRFAGRTKRPILPMLTVVSERLKELSVETPINPSIRANVLRHWNARWNLPKGRAARLPMVLRELITLRYHRFSSGTLTAAKDLLFVE